MPVKTPEPRLPLEPEEYPLYKPPSRLGCSGLSLVTLVTIVVFALLFWQVTPRIVRGLTGVNPSSLLGGDQAGASSTPGEGAMETQTVVAALPSNTPAPITTPTPKPVCVKVTGTGGIGTPLRKEPSTAAARVVAVGEGAVFQVFGPDVTTGTDSAGRPIVWKYVILPNDGRKGYVLARYLEPSDCP